MTSGPTIQGSLHLHHVSSLPTLAICRSSSLGSVVCSSLAPGSRITWLGSIDLQCTVLVLSLFHERFLDSHLSYKMSSTATQRMDKAYSLMAAMMIVLGAVAYGLAARVWSPPGGLFGFSALEVVGWNLLLGCLNASPPMLFDGACSLGGMSAWKSLDIKRRAHEPRYSHHCYVRADDRHASAIGPILRIDQLPAGSYEFTGCECRWAYR